jgi:hypothetical protein
MDWLRQLFGGSPKPTYYGDAPRGQWPTKAAIKQTDGYGMPVAAYVDPTRQGMTQQPRTFMELRAMDDALGEGRDLPKRATPITEGNAKRMQEAATAANYSAIAALGFDPRRLALSDAPAERMNIGGRYYPEADQMWSASSNTTPVHESFHRGVKQMREAGVFPKAAEPYREETLVRALMLKNFGPVEKGRGDLGDRQVAQGAALVGNPHDEKVLTAIENAAAQMIARQQPRGPR